ncbi:pyridoxal phosphate-dependent aminotransferase [Brevibacillus sp. B_LB10_24]|uniref:pyridoxal phosphate-dependent aminotransferase n=1 Tax=Brevibacillus sp. B_LB10_24 TaxID=3380645 RepID=UPI0038B934FC
MKSLAQARSKLPRSGIREIMEHSAKLPDVIHLEVGEPNADTPEHVQQAAIEAIRSGYTHYTANAGFPSLRDAICSHLKRQYLLTAHPDQIVVTPGAVTAIAASLLALADAGDEVLIPDPGWPNYEQMVLSQESTPVRYTLHKETGFLPDMAELERLVTAKTKAIIINSPANPTGAMFPEQTLKELLAFAGRHDLYVISDEVYDGIVFEGKHCCPLSLDQEGRVISVFGFSKNYAMTGWRVGYAVAPLAVAPMIAKLLEPMVSCASSVSQKAAEAAINGPQDFVKEMSEVYKRRRDQVCELFQNAGIQAYSPAGAFYMLVDIAGTGMAGREFALALIEEERVAAAPGATFGASTEQMIRISLATEDSLLLEGVKRICRFIAGKTKG